MYYRPSALPKSEAQWRPHLFCHSNSHFLHDKRWAKYLLCSACHVLSIMAGDTVGVMSHGSAYVGDIIFSGISYDNGWNLPI